MEGDSMGKGRTDSRIPGKKRGIIFAVLMAILLSGGLPRDARAEEEDDTSWLVSAEEAVAEDLTAESSFIPGSVKKDFHFCTDGKYTTRWQSYGGTGASLEVKAPEGKTFSGIWIQWYDHPHAVVAQIRKEEEWTDYSRSAGEYLSDFLKLPGGTEAFRIVNPKGKTTPMSMAQVHVYGPGVLPRNVQVWDPPCEKADLMLLAAHPDDEVLWFGGLLPTYAGERKKAVQVCMMVPTLPCRRLELLDSIWTCGVHHYPVTGYLRDSYSESLKRQYQMWDRNSVGKLVTGWVRRFKPDVLVTHDINGEYGHGEHRACADTVIRALDDANDKRKYPESLKEYGVWNVPKCYLHLYGENTVDMDWQAPLAAFGGRTGFEVSQDAFRCHVSQQTTDYHVEDDGPCDCSLFGLYRSLVGPDTGKRDFFENLDP